MSDLSNTKVCHKLKSGSIMSPEGVVFYAKYLLTAHENKKGEDIYKLELCISPDKDLKVLKNEMGKIALEHCDGDATRAKKLVEKRFINPNDKPSGGKPAGEQFEGWTLVRASTKTQPDFVWPNGTKMTTEEARKSINSGDHLRATLTPYWSDNEENKGVCIGLQNIQLISKGTPIGYVKPAGEEEFGAVEGAEDLKTETKSEGGSKSEDPVDDLFG